MATKLVECVLTPRDMLLYHCIRLGIVAKQSSSFIATIDFFGVELELIFMLLK
jgi:hypothetical protein